MKINRALLKNGVPETFEEEVDFSQTNILTSSVIRERGEHEDIFKAPEMPDVNQKEEKEDDSLTDQSILPSFLKD